MPAIEILEDVVHHGRFSSSADQTCRSTRPAPPGGCCPRCRRSNTTIASLLSRHSEIAVESITFEFALQHLEVGHLSKALGVAVLRGILVVDAVDLGGLAAGRRRGSPSRAATAAVSVVKYGLPVPAAKITTRPFSRCRIARRRMYGSATPASRSRTARACRRPCCSSASCSASEFITVASMPM